MTELSGASFARLYRFGPFEADPRSGELRKHGVHIRLREQPFQILLMLLQRPGVVLLREEICLKLWPNNTVVEFDHGINTAIKRLRDALGETADKPRHIETVGRRGYRFLGEVELVAAENPPDTANLTGAAVLHYRILEKLGSGGMGVVYRAEDLKLGRQVALKFLPCAASEAPWEIRARFEREARAASALNHPNICTVYAVEDFAGQPLIAMELVEGETLADRLTRGPMPLEEVLPCGWDIASALAAAHARGVIHRDLKPANIMLTNSGAKVLDFGLAKREGADVMKSAVGAIVGTPAYLAPELLEGRPADACSDIFSFGCVLYEMVAGRRARESEQQKSISGAIGAVIQRCLLPDPEQRIQSMEDVKASIGAIRQKPAPRQRRAWWWAVASGCGLAAAAVWWSVKPPVPQDVVALPFTALPGIAQSASLSRDGSTVAFAWNGYQQNNFDIYVKKIGGKALQRLTTDPAADYFPSWSPDGRYLAFLRTESRAASSVMLVEPVGGPERKLTDLGPVSFFFTRTVPLSWTPDGKWLAVAAKESPQESRAIWLVSVDSGERRRLTSPPDPSVEDRNPSISPDGTMLAFSRGGLIESLSRPYVLSLSRDYRPAGAPRPLSVRPTPVISGIAWANAREIVYGAGGNGAAHLRRAHVSGERIASRLNFEDAAFPAISIGARRLVYTSSNYNGHIWRANVRTGERAPLIAARGLHYFPEYSPDGRRIAFASTRSGDWEVWTCDADGANCAPLTSFGGPLIGSPRWSPDGRWLILESRPEDKSEILLVPSDGGAPRRMGSGHDDISPSWSHDGRWIYFSSTRSGRVEIWKMPAQGGAATQLTTKGGMYPNESPDGKSLYYVKWDEPGLFQRPVEGGEEVQLRPRLAGADSFPFRSSPSTYLNWALARDGLYFIMRKPWNGAAAPGPLPSPILWFQDFAGGSARMIAEAESVTGMAVSPDGAWVIGTQNRNERSDLMLVEGFQ